VAIVEAEHTIERSLDNLPSSIEGPLLDLTKAAIEPAEEAEISCLIDRMDGRRGRHVRRGAGTGKCGAPEEREAEYLDYRQFIITWEMLKRVTECQALEAPQMSRNTHAAWLKDHGVHALRFPLPHRCFLK
jgi:nuclear pore complex protein Nup107